MTAARTRSWIGFGVTATILLAVLSWLTTALVRLDHDEVSARRQATLHERLRLALWRMDSWLSPQLAREAMRPASEFQAFPSAATAWTRGFNRLGPDEVVVRSPLLGSESALFPLHFELTDAGLRSPQVPLANERDVAEANGVDVAVLQRAEARLREYSGRITRAALDPKVRGAEEQLPKLGCNVVAPEAPAQVQQGVAEYSNRQRSMKQSVSNAWVEAPPAPGLLAPVAAAGAEVTGPLVPVWLEGAPAVLVFARRVRQGTATTLQGVVVDWQQLQNELIGLVADLFPTAGTRLVRCEAPEAADQPAMLASVPARLEASCEDALTSGLPLPAILSVTWGVTVLGLLVLGFTLRASIGYGERRARFASAVTHELRTPLTTFRMYSEMLAEGMVRDQAVQHEYLTTLQRESDRLARVVENVLAWSRLEEGRFRSRREVLAVPSLVERVAAPLQRRLEEAAMQLVVEIAPDAASATVATDEDAVGQILFNLVDNAAKYARGAADVRVLLQVGLVGERVRFTIRDHGPGIPPQHRQRIFAPFDRGAVAASSNEVPGVGLGLALARGLARDLHGELRYEVPGEGSGAGFVFELAATTA